MSKNKVITKVFSAGKSLRTTIPQTLAIVMEIEDGDILKWNVSYNQNHEVCLTITKDDEKKEIMEKSKTIKFLSKVFKL